MSHFKLFSYYILDSLSKKLTFFDETQIKLMLFLSSFVNFFVHLYYQNIQKAITTERNLMSSFMNFFVHLYYQNIQKAITTERNPILIKNSLF